MGSLFNLAANSTLANASTELQLLHERKQAMLNTASNILNSQAQNEASRAFSEISTLTKITQAGKQHLNDLRF